MLKYQCKYPDVAFVGLSDSSIILPITSGLTTV